MMKKSLNCHALKQINAVNKRHFSSILTTQQKELPATTHKPKPYKGPSFEEVEKLRKTYLSPGLLTYYQKPVMLVEGKKQYLWDDKGKRYLDFFGGIVTISVGHCHEEIVKAGTEQMATLMHTTNIYYHPEIAQFGKELADKMPGNLKVTYFVNSGSEANDLAILMARLYTKNQDILALRNCYHGMSGLTMGITSLSTWKYPVPQGEGIKHVLTPNQYRGPFKYDDPDAADKYHWDVQNVIEQCTPGAIAGWISEPIQGVGGTVCNPPGYLKKVYETVRKHGGVCIADEVQTGFGRLGTHFWGFESEGVMPDIVTMAKGIGNGTPLAAVVTTPEIAKTLAQKIHFNTYGGNPVSSAIGRAVLRVIDKEQLQKNSLETGNLLINGLNKLKEKYPIIGDVRGKGLMLGVELVKDRKTLEPAKEETARVFERCKELGLLLGKGGLYGNVFRIKPPMCISKEDVEFALFVMDKAFSEL
ncbi:hypothetical protein ABK040_005146 [Willaertia magna]